ncbi:MAG: ribonuclease P protein component [Lactococcus lactis]|nr:ribonuclease P protein component [Psychroflexus sp.]MDN6310831.1 ribonuclease P protein component [Psychroflexus sp.]MDN6342526.1 ribonuclease P protein component [Lactococcus lactis]
MSKQSFPKAEHLKSKKGIDELFLKRQSVKAFPIRLMYHQNAEQTHKVGFVVPKRLIRLAVNRNKIKRQLREAYRTQKQEIQELSHQDMMFVLIGKKPLSFQETEACVLKCLTKLKEKADEKENNN